MFLYEPGRKNLRVTVDLELQGVSSSGPLSVCSSSGLVLCLGRRVFFCADIVKYIC